MQGSNTRSITDDADHFANVVLHPALPMQKVLEMQDQILLLTTCQPPFFIEVRITMQSVDLLSSFLSSFLSVCLSACLSVCLSVYPSVCLSVCC